jgi:SMI1/KNR4 family protein SUKH-1
VPIEGLRGAIIDSSAIDERLARVAKKVSERGIRLAPCLSEVAVASFEARLGISLPRDYREFILKIGNGGAGPPGYGWMALGEVAKNLDPEYSRQWRELTRIREPFPLTEPWVWEDGDQSTEGTRSQVQDGSIFLGDDGCGQYWFLVVSGRERGNVWMLSDVGIAPTVPKRDFLRWYEDWLDGNRAWW